MNKTKNGPPIPGWDTSSVWSLEQGLLNKLSVNIFASKRGSTQEARNIALDVAFVRSGTVDTLIFRYFYLRPSLSIRFSIRILQLEAFIVCDRNRHTTASRCVREFGRIDLDVKNRQTFFVRRIMSGKYFCIVEKCPQRVVHTEIHVVIKCLTGVIVYRRIAFVTNFVQNLFSNATAIRSIPV